MRDEMEVLILKIDSYMLLMEKIVNRDIVSGNSKIMSRIRLLPLTSDLVGEWLTHVLQLTEWCRNFHFEIPDIVTRHTSELRKDLLSRANKTLERAGKLLGSFANAGMYTGIIHAIHDTNRDPDGNIEQLVAATDYMFPSASDSDDTLEPVETLRTRIHILYDLLRGQSQLMKMTSGQYEDALRTARQRAQLASANHN